MLNYMKSVISELSTFLQDFSNNNQLPTCSLANGTQLFSNVITNKCTSHLAINFEVKSSEKQPFDIRLSFNSVLLKEWWPLLEQLCSQLKCFEAEHCHVSLARLIETIHAVDIDLCRKRTVDQLLRALCNQQAIRSNHQAVVLKVEQSRNYFSRTRLDMVANVVENLLKDHCASVIGSSAFQQFVSESGNFHVNWQELVDKYRQVLDNDKRITSLDTNNNYLRKILSGFHLLDGFLSQLELSDEMTNLVIMVVSESEFIRAQVTIDLLRLSTRKSNKYSFKLVKVAGVSFEEANQVDSFASYKNLLQKVLIIDDISPDNRDTIAQTMESFLLLTPKCHSPISKLVHFRNESIFVQYNIARIKSIIEKYTREYLSEDTEMIVSFSCLTSGYEYNLILVNLLRMQQLNHSLLVSLTDPSSTEYTFEVNRMIDLLKKTAHSFSVYYRNVKVLAEPLEHLMPSIAARVHFCRLILKQMEHYFSLMNISTAKRM